MKNAQGVNLCTSQRKNNLNIANVVVEGKASKEALAASNGKDSNAASSKTSALTGQGVWR